MTSPRVVAALLFAAGAFGAARDADAFCRTTTGTPAPDGVPGPCPTDGTPLYHLARCVPYRLLARESPVVPNAALSRAMAKAFATWSAESDVCAPGITSTELSPVSGDVVAHYREGERAQNVVGVPDTWVAGSQTLALTTLSFELATGAIVDVDLELNPNVRWSHGGLPPADAFDVESAVTHEVGHMLGLAHTEDTSAAMYPSYRAGSTKPRTLGRDDQEGICAIYPDASRRVTGSGTVASVSCASAPAADPEEDDGGCSAGPAPNDRATSTSGALATLGALGVLVAWRRPRRQPGMRR